jgi:GGDEF domain-containing protein
MPEGTADIPLMLSNSSHEPQDTHDYDLDDVLQAAAAGRRLVIFDRATGLYAYWYLQLRGDEEIARARRYQKQLSIVSLWAPTPDAISQLATHLHDHLRDTDLAGYLNNGHFVVLLTETGPEGASIVLWRALKVFGAGIDAAVVSYPDDGDSFDMLLEAAKARASQRT